MFEKGQIVSLEIVDMSDRGMGIGRAGGVAVFVDHTVVGDHVIAKITIIKKNYAIGRLVRLEKPSKTRRENFCRYGSICGGCAYGTMTYEGQLALKEKQVKDKLIRIGKLENPTVRSIRFMEEPFGYRNKATMPIHAGETNLQTGGVSQNIGSVAVGFYKKQSHEVMDCRVCRIQNPVVSGVAEAVRSFMASDHITAYDDKRKVGLMRSLTVRTGFATGEVMVILGINGKKIPNVDKLIGIIDYSVYEAGFSLESVVLDSHGDKKTIAGKGIIKDVIRELKIEISADSFYQVNPAMTYMLYDKIKEYTELTGGEIVLDLYCGAGTIGLYLADKTTMILGIESNNQAVLDANRNATINGIVNARYIHGKVEHVLPKLVGECVADKNNYREKDEDLYASDLQKAAKEADVAILNPPRAGCHGDLLEAVCKVMPARIVYMSCDPATLARDIRNMVDKGYAFVEATPFDNFPWTTHVETVALLSKLDVNNHIEVEIELNEMDLTSAESKATYAQIKEYVLEKFGLKVSTLYIAQIKKKCGIKLREHYNKSKKEKQVIPQCTPEKEETIMEALRHFKMI